ncbi:hypothetical protein HCY52_07930 [Acinetobacter radioresistens]|uniref:hypothetical protein n=1 Tax=Acinetobacter radioresistens TaxID=40216 RepID=UPI0020061746|nr:hypothetical protein [Acinetobacter radioresistens]MCK4083743.1 hypothetical protein [Acinetobacter radioresistens]
MGLLLDWFLKSSEKDQVVLDYSKLNSLFVSQNGLYRNKDGSTPTIEDFEKHGFSEDQYFLAVYGRTQKEIQDRLMQRNANKRGTRRKMINSRLAKNTQRLADSAKSKKKRKTPKQFDINEFAFFAPFGIYHFGVRDGSPNDLIELSYQLTGTPLGIFEWFGAPVYGHENFENPMDDMMSWVTDDINNELIHNTYGDQIDYNNSFDHRTSNNDVF